MTREKQVLVKNRTTKVRSQTDSPANLAQNSPDGADSLKAARLFVAGEIYEWFFHDIDRAMCDMQAFAVLLQGNSFFIEERDAMGRLADGFDNLKALAEIMECYTSDPKYVALTEGERWAAHYFRCEFKPPISQSLEGFFGSIGGIGKILASCNSTRKVGMIVSEMETDWAKLNNFLKMVDRLYNVQEETKTDGCLAVCRWPGPGFRKQTFRSI